MSRPTSDAFLQPTFEKRKKNGLKLSRSNGRLGVSGERSARRSNNTSFCWMMTSIAAFIGLPNPDLLRVFILAGSRTTADHVPPPPVTCSIVDISGETPAGSFRSPNSASPMVRAVPCSVYTLSVPLGHASNAVCSPVLRRPRSRA